MTEKPDYMQMARGLIPSDSSKLVVNIATILEALDKAEERANVFEEAQRQALTSLDEMTNAAQQQHARAEKAEAELQALRERAEKVLQLAQASDIEKAETDCRAFLRSLLPQPAADPLVEAIKDCGYATLDCIEPEFAAALREALARHGLTITEKQG